MISTKQELLGIRLLIIMLLALLSACATNGGKAVAVRPDVLDYVNDIAAENGDRILVTRDYMDELKIDHQNVRRRYQYAWNYSKGVAQERTFDEGGQQLSLTDKPALSLSATPEEQSYAFSQVRSDRRWASHLVAESEFYGGFIFREPESKNCSENSRCIHIFASSDGGQVTSLHLIFNLMTGEAFEAEPGSEIYKEIAKHAKGDSQL